MIELKICHTVVFLWLGIMSITIASCKSNPSSKENDTSQNSSVFSPKWNLQQLNIIEVDCNIRAITAIDDQNMWYAGSKGQYGYTEDGGQHWVIDSLNHPDQPALEFRSIAVLEDHIFLLSVGSPALLYKSTDKGISWKVVYSEYDTLAFYDAMAFWNDSEGIAMGDPIGGCLSIIKTMDAGNTWTKMSCNQLPPAIAGEAAFAASNSNIALYEVHVWIVTGGKAARVLHSPDKGENWEVFNTPIVQGGQMTGIFTCDFYDENTGIIMGGDWNKKESREGNKAITRDGGKTWQLIGEGSYPGYRSCVQYLRNDSPAHLLAVGIPGLSYSADGGDSWKHVSDEGFYTIRATEKGVWLAGNGKIGRWDY